MLRITTDANQETVTTLQEFEFDLNEFALLFLRERERETLFAWRVYTGNEICIFSALNMTAMAPSDFTQSRDHVLRYQAERFQKHFRNLNFYGSLGRGADKNLCTESCVTLNRKKTFSDCLERRRFVASRNEQKPVQRLDLSRSH